MTTPLNAQIAEALGWRTWEARGKWFMEREGDPGKIEVTFVPDYIAILRDVVKMKTGNRSTDITKPTEQPKA